MLLAANIYQLLLSIIWKLKQMHFSGFCVITFFQQLQPWLQWRYTKRSCDDWKQETGREDSWLALTTVLVDHWKVIKKDKFTTVKRLNICNPYGRTMHWTNWHSICVCSILMYRSVFSSDHRRSQGVQWVHLHPPGRWKKIFSGVIYRENV